MWSISGCLRQNSVILVKHSLDLLNWEDPKMVKYYLTKKVCNRQQLARRGNLVGMVHSICVIWMHRNNKSLIETVRNSCMWIILLNSVKHTNHLAVWQPYNLQFLRCHNLKGIKSLGLGHASDTHHLKYDRVEFQVLCVHLP